MPQQRDLRLFAPVQSLLYLFTLLRRFFLLAFPFLCQQFIFSFHPLHVVYLLSGSLLSLRLCLSNDRRVLWRNEDLPFFVTFPPIVRPVCLSFPSYSFTSNPPVELVSCSPLKDTGTPVNGERNLASVVSLFQAATISRLSYFVLLILDACKRVYVRTHTYLVLYKIFSYFLIDSGATLSFHPTVST